MAGGSWLLAIKFGCTASTNGDYSPSNLKFFGEIMGFSLFRQPPELRLKVDYPKLCFVSRKTGLVAYSFVVGDFFAVLFWRG